MKGQKQKKKNFYKEIKLRSFTVQEIRRKFGRDEEVKKDRFKWIYNWPKIDKTEPAVTSLLFV